MRTLMKIGPIAFEDGDTNAYLLLGPDYTDMTMSPSDAEGITTLKARAGNGPIVCEDSLSIAASQAGLRIGEPPQAALEARAAIAVALEHGPLFANVKSLPLIVELISAAVDFEEAAPWEVFLSDVAIDLTVDAPRASYEGCVMGQMGEVFGLVLYKEKGTVARVVELDDDTEAAAFDSMSVMLETDTNFAATAVEQWSGVQVAPALMRMKRGEQLPVTEEEVMTLTASLRAVVALTDGKAPVGTCHVGKRKLTVRARIAPVNAPLAASADAPDFSKVGRNDPCPCGSGKKFKRCHLGESKAAAPSAARPDNTVHGRDRRLVELLYDFCAERFGKPALDAAVKEAFGQRKPSLQLVAPLLAYDWPVEGKTLSDHFLEARSDLSTADRQWLEAQRTARVAVWEVERIERGVGFDAVNLQDQRRAFITEVKGSNVLLPRHAVLARVVNIPGSDSAVICGSHERTLGPREADELLQRFHAAGPAGSEWAAEVRLLQLWDDAVSKSALEAASPLVIRNTDGDTILAVEDQFAISRGGFPSVLSALLKLEGAQVDSEDDRGAQLTFTRPGNPMHATWKNTVVGSARVTATKLTLNTNSEQRADQLKARVTTAAGSAVTFKKRGKKPMPEMRGGQEMMLDAQANVSSEPVDLMRDWLDTVIPALGDRTPREAIADPAGRRKAHLLLKEMELHHAQRPDGPFDPAVLRRQLGLDLAGNPNVHADLDRAIGHGRKASETLLDFAAPLFDQAPNERSPSQLRPILDFAAMVWNVVALEEQGASEKEVERARAELKPGRVAAQLLASFDDLVARKRARYGGDLRLFDVEVLKQPGGANIRVEVRLPADVIERATKAGFKP